jgi:hypothetical protein
MHEALDLALVCAALSGLAPIGSSIIRMRRIHLARHGFASAVPPSRHLHQRRTNMAAMAEGAGQELPTAAGIAALRRPSPQS